MKNTRYKSEQTTINPHGISIYYTNSESLTGSLSIKNKTVNPEAIITYHTK